MRSAEDDRLPDRDFLTGGHPQRRGWISDAVLGPAVSGLSGKLTWVREEMGGNIYRSETLKAEGWLCPALFKYFDKSPPEIYAKAEALR